MATIIPTHMPRKTGMAMSFGARPPTWPRPVTMSDMSLACRAVMTHARPASARSHATTPAVTRRGERL
jgi:hypothetical protein